MACKLFTEGCMQNGGTSDDFCINLTLVEDAMQGHQFHVQCNAFSYMYQSKSSPPKNSITIDVLLNVRAALFHTIKMYE